MADSRLSRRAIFLSRSKDESIFLDGRASPITVSVEGERVDETTTLLGQLDRGFVLLLAEQIVLLLHELPLGRVDRASTAKGDLPRDDCGLVGESPAIEKVREQISRVADLSLTVLIRGETGTGKELVAQSIYRHSTRKKQPYVVVNMAALPASLAASELFGSAKGAFTGADQNRQGYFEKASGGTIFLDEIGETPLEVQPLLLRVLENGEVQSVGGGKSKKVDVRVLAATDLGLEAAVAEGMFRSPLLHRLSSFEIRLPPLRERREDQGRLFYYFLNQFSQELLGGPDSQGQGREQGAADLPRVPAWLIARLALSDWPGNVRQFANVVRHLVVVSREAEEIDVHPDEIESLLQRSERDRLMRGRPERASEPEPLLPRKTKTYRDPDDVGAEELVEAMRSCAWQPSRAASILGVSRPSLHNLIAKSPDLRSARDIEAQEIVAAKAEGMSIEEMAAAFKVSVRALKLRMTELGLR